MENSTESLHFIEEIIDQDLKAGKFPNGILTRFPPEPNGYLHIGHSKSICLNFDLAAKYRGKTNLRFDDTNPSTEETEYVDAIKYDIKWLGYEWDEREYFASDYFEKLYDYALSLIDNNLAYVDDQSSEVIAEQKGSPTIPGVESPFRNRTSTENRELFENMRAGLYNDGEKVLRAKIDMSSSNMLLRDPIIYRIKKVSHHRTGNLWCIYPMYDFAHGQSDALEQVTHSICTLEFENHRPLYNWFIEKLNLFPSRQIEFARLNLTYTVMSKRKLLQLVNENIVDGWDDPRMPTISGMRRRGYPAAAIREFARRVGIAKRENTIDVGFLEFCVREELNKTSHRLMAVLDPIEVLITNYPEHNFESLPAENNPENPSDGHRLITFAKKLYIERDDFMENPPKKYFRLSPGQMVRLKHAYIIKCDNVIFDDSGKIIRLECTYYPESKSGADTSGLNVKGTIHWVEHSTCIDAEIRLYDRLFKVENPDGDKETSFMNFLNQDSLKIVNAKIEPAAKNYKPESPIQFLRLGYFTPDKDSTPENLVFNKTVGLKDTWAKISN
jgi:glutaminyl-tRNA synthetase